MKLGMKLFGFGRLGGAARNGRAAGSSDYRPGAMYAGLTGTRTPEVARILYLTTDEFNVRHIRFALTYRYQEKMMEAGERTLSLATFAARFPKPVPESSQEQPNEVEA
jgi:hypothetical protein